MDNLPERSAYLRNLGAAVPPLVLFPTVRALAPVIVVDVATESLTTMSLLDYAFL